MEIISRKDARARGLNHYFNGKPCMYGHLAPRHVHKSECIECRRVRGNIYNAGNKKNRRVYDQKRHGAIADMIAVLRKEQPELLKEFGL